MNWLKRKQYQCFFHPIVALGGTSESDPIFSPAVRKHLRKTRLELLHKEYEVRTGGVLWLSRWTTAVKLPHTNGPFALSPAVFNLSKGIYCIYVKLSCIKMPPLTKVTRKHLLVPEVVPWSHSNSLSGQQVAKYTQFFSFVGIPPPGGMGAFSLCMFGFVFNTNTSIFWNNSVLLRETKFLLKEYCPL